MLTNNLKISSLIHGDMVEYIIKKNNVGITEARLIISNMSFSDYRKLEEASVDIVPPSGQTIAPGNPPGQQSQPATKAPTQATGPTIVPGSTQQDPRGVQVKNPVTGKIEWMKPTTPTTPGQGVPPGAVGSANQLQQQAMSEDADLARMKILAGIAEDSSGGASCSGGIAVAPMPMGNVKRRQPTNEQQPKEYTPKGPAKTIIGDTKPGQASGELSANLAARGKKTASRINNGFKK